MDKGDERMCYACYKTPSVLGHKLKLCGGCLCAVYCDEKCQRTTYPWHRLFCFRDKFRARYSGDTDLSQEADVAVRKALATLERTVSLCLAQVAGTFIACSDAGKAASNAEFDKEICALMRNEAARALESLKIAGKTLEVLDAHLERTGKPTLRSQGLGYPTKDIPAIIEMLTSCRPLNEAEFRAASTMALCIKVAAPDYLDADAHAILDRIPGASETVQVMQDILADWFNLPYLNDLSCAVTIECLARSGSEFFVEYTDAKTPGGIRRVHYKPRIAGGVSEGTEVSIEEKVPANTDEKDKKKKKERAGARK